MVTLRDASPPHSDPTPHPQNLPNSASLSIFPGKSWERLKSPSESSLHLENMQKTTLADFSGVGSEFFGGQL